MEITQIRFFLEAAQTQHITRSAEKLHISQPSLTQAIHKLEKNLGVPLFARSGRNVVLTEYGRYLQGKLMPVMEELDSIPRELQTMAKLATETIHINVLALSILITNAIIEYKRKNGSVNFQLMQYNNSNVFDIKIETKLMHQDTSHKSADKQMFSLNEKIFLAVPDNQKYKNKNSVRLSEVIDEGFICLSGSRQFRNICDRICRHIAFRPNIIFESDNSESVINMIASNMGVGFYPEFSWGNTENENVRLLEIEDALFRRDIVITANLNKSDNSVVLNFFDFLKNYIIEKSSG